mgnify:CR=1 FL=1
MNRLPFVLRLEARRVRSACAATIIGMIMFGSSAHAVCDFPSNPPPNSVVTCSGLTTTPFEVDDITGVQVTNTGTWTGSGDTFLMDFGVGDLTGSRLINSGVMTWSDAQNPSTASRGPMNMFFRNNQATMAEAVNTATGVITVTGSTAADIAIGGMVVQARGPNGAMDARNEGTIDVSNSSDDITLYGMIVRADSTVVTENSGTILVDLTTPSAGLIGGIRSSILDDSTIPVSNTVTNSGQIVVSPGDPDVGFGLGIWLTQDLPTNGTQPAVHTVVNSGTVDVGGVEAYAVFYQGDFPDIQVDIDNSGSILTRAQDFAFAIASATTTADFSIVNTGEIVGDVFTSNGNDALSMFAGELIGDSSFSGGEDAVVLADGIIDGDLFFGDGSDAFTLQAGTFTGQADGGDDVSSADGQIDTLEFDGFSGPAPAFLNWELVDVSSGAVVSFGADFTTETLTTDAASTAILADALSVTGDVVNDGTVDIRSTDATGTATIVGDVSGSGTLELSVNVGSDRADVLAIVGDTSGSSIAIIPNSVDFEPATGNDVLVVEVTGTTSVGDFTLPNGSTTQEINGVTYELSLIGTDWFLTASGSPGGFNALPVPTLSPWALILLIGLFLLASFHASRLRSCNANVMR